MLYFGRVWFFHAHGSLVYFVLISTESFSAYIQHLFMIHFVETPRNFKIWHHILSEYLLLIYHFLCGFFPSIYLFPFSLNWLKFLILNYILCLILVVLMYNQYQLIPWKRDFQRLILSYARIRVEFYFLKISYVHKIML